MGFSRQGYWSEWLSPSAGDLPDPGIKPASSTLAGGFFTTEPHGKYEPIALLSVYSRTNTEQHGQAISLFFWYEQDDAAGSMGTELLWWVWWAWCSRETKNDRQEGLGKCSGAGNKVVGRGGWGARLAHPFPQFIISPGSFPTEQELQTGSV